MRSGESDLLCKTIHLSHNGTGDDVASSLCQIQQELEKSLRRPEREGLWLFNE